MNKPEQPLLEGGVGRVNTLYATYKTDPVKDTAIRKDGWTDMETQVRNRSQFNWLSGDHIVEQPAHSLNLVAWAMGVAPLVQCTANDGRPTHYCLI